MANGNNPWTADRIRSLRGSASRAEFAAQVGVSALTVYRWELPDGAPEARRPRGAIARRLAAMFGPAAPVGASGATGASAGTGARASTRAEMASRAATSATLAVVHADEPTTDELVELLPILEHLLCGDFARVERELLVLVASGRLRTAATRALATQALARYQLWARGDALGAFATLLPVLHQANDGVLPPSVELEVHVTAALVFAGTDGRVFDAGKINAHVARAERLATPPTDAQQFLLWLAQLLGAYIEGDPALLEHVLARRREVDRDLRWMVLRCFAIEARLISGYYARAPLEAAQELQQLLELTAASRLSLHHARALMHAARDAIDEARPPAQVLALTRRGHALCREAGLATGVHLLYGSYAEGEALFRQGQLAEAEQAWREALGFCEELRWAPGTFVFYIVRSLLLTGRAAEVRALADRVVAMRCEIYAAIMRSLCEIVLAIADVIDGMDASAAVERIDAAVRQIDQENNAWTFLRRGLALVHTTTAILVGDREQATRALRQAERTFDAAPAAAGNAVLLGLRGLELFRNGGHLRARPLLERAREALDAAGDRVSGALVRHILALIAGDLDEPEAAAALARSTEELRGLGVVSYAAVEVRARPVARVEVSEPGGLVRTGQLAPAFQRLLARGLSATHVQRELVAIAAELYPGASVRLDEIDSRGVPSALHHAGAAATPTEWAGFGDGAGRRYQLGISPGSTADDRAQVLAMLASVAGVALEVAALRGLAPRAQAAPGSDGAVPELPGFIAASSAMRRLKLDLARLAKSRATIIITGESGAGKEVVARALHDLSVRANRPYVAFNCAAVPRELFEGQLFGYRKGAFTGAVSDHPGVIRAAQGGTLFLDEIGELPLEVQPKLLRFLENGEVFPLGEQKPVHVDVRVIAATFRELDKLVRDGKFREDLFYRLQVVPLRVPPLRERPEDIVALARFFVERLTPDGQEPPVLSPGALVALTTHAWPGNVRELRNVIERSLAFEPRPTVLDADHLRIS